MIAVFNKIKYEKGEMLTQERQCHALCDLVSFVQFKKREKQPWRIVTFSKVAGFQPATLLKVTRLHGCFSSFSNCENGAKSCNASLINLVPLLLL